MKYLIVDNVRSAHNVGSMFRTADGAGVSKIFLVGYTPTPIDRFGRPQPEITKTSLGASETIPWEQVTNEEIVKRIQDLQSDGVEVVAVEQTAQSIDMQDFIVPEKVAYIVGNEIEGVQPSLLEAADQAIEIPMAGTKESLNVSVTAGIVLFFQ